MARMIFIASALATVAVLPAQAEEHRFDPSKSMTKECVELRQKIQAEWAPKAAKASQESEILASLEEVLTDFFEGESKLKLKTGQTEQLGQYETLAAQVRKPLEKKVKCPGGKSSVQSVTMADGKYPKSKSRFVGFMCKESTSGSDVDPASSTMIRLVPIKQSEKYLGYAVEACKRSGSPVVEHCVRASLEGTSREAEIRGQVDAPYKGIGVTFDEELYRALKERNKIECLTQSAVEYVNETSSYENKTVTPANKPASPNTVTTKAKSVPK